ncbi:MAG: MFS transporter [Desulfobacteraceae bacterium]|nr:MAG: MFS transporter [Desulfobacteraceae bacterium]
MNERSAFFYGWIIVGMAAVTMTLVYGVRHSFSVFFPSILNQFGWSRGSTAIMLSIHIFAYGALAPIAGMLGDRWRPRVLMPIGIIILGSAAAACGLANELWHFYLIFGICAPLGLCFCGWPLLAPALSNWFSTRKGLALGIGNLGGGLSFAYGIFVEHAISEFGWRLAYVAVGGSLIAILLPLSLLVFRYHPAEKGLEPYGGDSFSRRSPGGIPQPHAEDPGWTLREAMRTYQFWLLILSQFFFWGIGCYLILAHQVKFAEDAGFSGMFAASIFALYGILMAVGQVSSAVSDWIGRERTVILAGILTVIALISLVSVTDPSHSWLLYVYAIGFGLGSGLFSPTIFVGAADIFHGPQFGVISGFILTGMGVGGAIGPWLGGYIFDITGTYRIAFWFSILCIVLSCIAFLIVAPKNADAINRKRSAARCATLSAKLYH